MLTNASSARKTSERIRALRLEHGLTQAQLAELLSVSFVTVSRWENDRSSPSSLALQQIETAEEFGIDALGPGPRLVEPTDEAPAGPQPDGPFLDFLASPDQVKVFVEGERLTYGHLFNPVFATETSLIDPLPHQRMAVYEHMLPQARLRFLLADDAGAGKTIMAGMYIREMVVRRLVRRVLIVPPAGLVGNWRREMRQLFSLPFEIASGQDAKTTNPFAGEGSDLRIVSVDTLAGYRMFSRLQEPSVERYDLVIFDEAHKLSASRDPDLYVRRTERYRLAEALAGIDSGDARRRLSWAPTHVLLLTATPHMGKDYPYFALWRLLEPHVLSTPEAFTAFPREARTRHFLRRVKEEMVDLAGNRLYPTREAATHHYELKQGEVSEQKLYDETTDYIRYHYNRARVLNRSAARMVMSVFQRRLASSTWALLCSLQRRQERLEDLIQRIQSGELDEEQLRVLQLRSERELARDVFEEKTADEESADADGEENEFEENKALRGVIATSLAELEAERQKVKHLVALAERVYEVGDESKFEKLRELLEDPRHRNEKFLIFTEHRDTLNYLVRRLEGMGHTGRVAQIHGGMAYQERETQVEFFRRPNADRGALFLVATDAAGEGINLQFCWLMVNYDIPWNPARLEQRMGRIHRYKQKHDPVIIMNLVAGKTREGRVLKTLLEKLERMRKELASDKVFDVIGRLFEGISLKEYLETAITEEGAEKACRSIEGFLTPEQVRALEERQRRIYGEGGDVRRELERLRRQEEGETYRRLLPGYVRQYVEKAAPLAGYEIEGDPGGTFRLAPRGWKGQDTLPPALAASMGGAARKFTVHRPSDESPAIWLHPGEPVFESFREWVSARLRPAARRGATFVDAMADRPYFFHLARASVLRKPAPEFAGLRDEETLEDWLVGVKQYADGVVEQSPVEHLLVLKGDPRVAAKFGALIATAGQASGAVSGWVERNEAGARAERVRGELLARLPQRQDFLARGFDYQEAELAAQRARVTERARAGDPKAKADLARIREKQRLLAQERETAIRERQREPELIAVGEVELLAHALVVPSTDLADRKRQDAEVELIAMRVAATYEEGEGAEVHDVHTPELARRMGLPDYPGFDLLVRRPGCEERSIEVKGRAGIGEVEVSDNEWAKACNLRDRYWLYVVYECSSAHPRLLRVQDPFGKLLARNRGGVFIDEKSIFAAAER